jgi:hypothetical protein
MKELYELVKKEYNDFLNRGGIPVLEYPINSGDDWLVVEIGVTEKGVTFSFDQEYDVHFDDDIEEIGHGVFVYLFEDEIIVRDSFDAILTEIDCNITEGYLQANDLV